MTSTAPKIGTQIDVGSDFVSIVSLTIQNPHLAKILENTSVEDRLDRLIKIIGFGTETFNLLSSTAAAESLKTVALQIANDVGNKKDELINGVNQIAEKLSSETGDLSIKSLLDNWRIGFNELLLKNFDITNTESILSKFDLMIKDKSHAQNLDVLKRLSFDEEGSAINLLQNNLRKHVSDEFKEMMTELENIKTSLKIGDAVAGAEALQANRGNIFEDEIFELIKEFAREAGDIADNPGATKTNGIDGNDEGDITVEINNLATSGKKNLFVLECKLRKTRLSDSNLLKEIDKGISNRGARAGIIITEVGEGKDLDPFDFFHEHGNRAILDLDPKEPDPYALRFAYLWARWQCLKDDAKVLDSSVVLESLKSIRLAIGNVTTIKSNNTKAIGMLQNNSSLAETLSRQVSSEIEILEKIISDLESGVE